MTRRVGASNAAAECEGKQRFKSHTMAEMLARRMRRRHHAPISTYRCRTCGHWHYGTLKRTP